MSSHYSAPSFGALLTIDQVAAALACSKRTVQREIARGKLQIVKVAGLVRIPTTALEAYLAACSTVSR